MNPDDTIFALSSGAAPSGVAVIRLSGKRAGKIAAAISGLDADELLPRRALLRDFVDPLSGEKIDRGLLLWFAGPASFTGEDCAEFHCHGGRAVIARMLVLLGAQPECRPAEAGEFSRRALENGKLDLTKIEGLSGLINAETEWQRKEALALSTGALAEQLEHWRQAIMRLSAFLEAEFDFSDEDEVDAYDPEALAQDCTDLGGEISKYLSDSHNGEIIRDGFHVVLAGKPNSGKSTLLNALARRDVAIVSEEAGTTRDLVETRLDLDGFLVRLTDTAGIRDTQSAIEKEGILRAKAVMEAADLNLWLYSGENGQEPGMTKHSADTVLIRTKNDLSGGEKTREEISISAKTGDGLEELIELIVTRARNAIGVDNGVESHWLREHHRRELENCRDFLNEAGNLAEKDKVLTAETLRRARQALGNLTGRTGVEDMLDVIFSSLCIGK